jgi:hypothetical protein
MNGLTRKTLAAIALLCATIALTSWSIIAHKLPDGVRLPSAHAAEPTMRMNTRGPNAKGRVAISLATSPEVTLHEPVIFELTVENGLDEPVKIDLGHNFKSGVTVTVTRRGGAPVTAPPPSEEGFGAVGRVEIAPAGKYTRRLVLNEWYDFEQVGSYYVQLGLAAPALTADGRKVEVATSNTVAFQVKARDPEVLRERCEDLAAQIMSARSYSEAADATLTLNYIADPVAVPYLEKALSSGQMVEPIAVAGLERNGSREAVEALLDALKTQPGQVKEDLIRPALTRIKVRVSDPELQRKVEEALQKSS